MRRLPLALDIETVGQDWASLSEEVQAYLLDRAKSDAKREEVPNRLALHPGTGRTVAIALWSPDLDRGRVFVEGDEVGWSEFDAHSKIFKGTETSILREFWSLVGRHAGTIITYSGRYFDAPYLMIRSAILKVAPSRNLLPYRFSFREHCDLAEVLSFWNSRHPDGTLDFWCRQFGLPSPKTEVSGSNVGDLYACGKRDDIARYCLGDARATAQLYLRLKPIIRLFHPEEMGAPELLGGTDEDGGAFVDVAENSTDEDVE